MKERPILFSAPMVRAILSGSKTQTRRVVKPQPFCPRAEMQPWQVNGETVWRVFGVYLNDFDRDNDIRRCPYGAPGDRLWVRETFQMAAEMGVVSPADDYPIYKATDPDWEDTENWRWNPSIFMPRRASRITLEIVSVRVERLQQISQEDAAAEGVEGVNTGDFVTAYARLWESINGPGSWDQNPWVWVIQFKQVHIPVTNTNP